MICAKVETEQQLLTSLIAKTRAAIGQKCSCVIKISLSICLELWQAFVKTEIEFSFGRNHNFDRLNHAFIM